jgi:hypothetical protein
MHRNCFTCNMREVRNDRCTELNWPWMLYIYLTVRLRIILVGDQLEAQFLL